jgi:hypothetical protein
MIIQWQPALGFMACLAPLITHQYIEPAINRRRLTGRRQDRPGRRSRTAQYPFIHRAKERNSMMRRFPPAKYLTLAIGGWLLLSAPLTFSGERPFDPADEVDPESAVEDFRMREPMASPQIKQLLQQQRQFVQQNNLPFSIGLTSATGRPLPKLRTAPDVKTRTLQTMQNQNEEAARVLQAGRIPSVEHILNQRAAQPINPSLQINPQLQIRPRGLPEEEAQDVSPSEPPEGDKDETGEISSRAVSSPCASKSTFVYKQGTGQALSPIRDQKACGSCYSFAAAAAVVEASKRIRYGGVANISEQELIDCAGGLGHGFINGCDGFFIEPTMMHMQFDGVAKESNYPAYQAQDRGTCNNPYYRYSISTWG